MDDSLVSLGVVFENSEAAGVAVDGGFVVRESGGPGVAAVERKIDAYIANDQRGRAISSHPDDRVWVDFETVAATRA